MSTATVRYQVGKFGRTRKSCIPALQPENERKMQGMTMDETEHHASAGHSPCETRLSR